MYMGSVGLTAAAATNQSVQSQALLYSITDTQISYQVTGRIVV